MKVLEIISVRIPTGLNQRVLENLRTLCREIKESSMVEADVYSNGDFPGDLAIILSWEEASLKGERTGLGNTLYLLS